MRYLTLAFAILLASVTLVYAQTPNGDYTLAQSKSGQLVFSQYCSKCHGVSLQGQSGPALVGATFNNSYGHGSAKQLYDFVHVQMPADHPGSLTQTQYLDVTAFILNRNGFPAGTVPLSTSTLKGVNLAAPHESAPATTNEIVRAAAPQRTVYARLPSGTNVNITDQTMLGAGRRSDWILHGRTYDNQRYSPLTQITTDNVRSLVPAALVQTGMPASFETTPIVVDGVMYLTTPVVSNKMIVLAVNAVTGTRLWELTYNLSPFQVCCGPVNRGVAVGYGKVYFVTLDDHLVAVDATNGRVLWQKSIANPDLGYTETLAPQIYDGMVIVGSAGAEWPLRGFVAAYDARNGNQRWRWWSTDPKTYAGDSWKTGGATVWTTPAIDPKLGLAIFSTSNPNPDLSGGSRKGDNLYSDSIVALDVHTGKLKWYYQEVKHDVWDYDATSNVVLFDVQHNGQTIPAAAEAGKVGFVFIVDRRNGKLIRKSDPYVMMSKNAFTTPTAKGVDMLPGANGGAEWSPPAYSPQTHYLYILAMNQLMHFTTHSEKTRTGTIRLGSAFTNVTKHGIQNGPLVALDVETGKVAWTHMTAQPLIGGALTTAGNLVFFGEGAGWFDALDAKTGKTLWRYNLGAGVNAPPISYEIDGTQYIAVAAGGNFQLTYPYGDTLAIFKLSSPSPTMAPPPVATSSP